MCKKTGFSAYLAHSSLEPKVGLRADMDGLPISENSSCSWTSVYSGIMHGCGHDGHMATMIGHAKWLKLHEDKLVGPETLIFQQPEEGGSGARAMIEDGALEHGDQIFGWHNWPAVPFGQAVYPDGTVMAANGNLSINLYGRRGHASQLELWRDQLLDCGALIFNLAADCQQETQAAGECSGKRHIFYRGWR